MELPAKVEDCRRCGGPVVMLPERPAVEGSGGFTAGLTCLGCADLNAVPRGMVPRSRSGEDANARRLVDDHLAWEADWARIVDPVLRARGVHPDG